MSQQSTKSTYPSSQAAAPQVLIAQTDDVRQFARLLRSIGLKHTANVAVSISGFTFTVEEVKSLCATAFVPVNLFQTFEFNPPDTAPVFEISLDSLLQCLNIFGNAGSSGPVSSSSISGGLGSGGSAGSKRRWAGDDGEHGEESWTGGRKEKRTGMRMTWAGHGEPLSMFLQDDGKGPVTTCELITLQPEELMEQPFDYDDRCVEIIMKPEYIRDALLDLPPTSSRITLTATPPNSEVAPYVPQATGSSNNRRSRWAETGGFAIKAVGAFGETQLDYPNDKDVMETFRVDEKVSFSYHSSHFAMLSRALQQAIKLSISIESSGFLCVQMMMPILANIGVGDHQGLVEFKMNPLEEDE